jgi:hypothetical protein
MKAIRILQLAILVLGMCSTACIGGSVSFSFRDTVPDVILAGQTGVHKRFGAFVASGGDVNGDGYDDFAVTANRYNDCRGRAYLYFGGKDRVYKQADRVFDGEAPGDVFGQYIAFGDLNNDKYSDVLIGAPGYKNWQGRVYVYFGGTDMDEEPDMIFNGEPGTRSFFGRVIDTADIDRDGYTDLAVVALGFNEDSGRTYLYFGGRSMDTIPDKAFDGEHPGDLIGREMDMGADVNGDGYGDLIFGSRAWRAGKRRGSPQGRAYLYFGGPKEAMDTKCDRVFTGQSPGDQFGSSVCLFDIDGDDHAEVLIGARGYNRGEGRMYLYWGRTDFDTNPDLIFEGEVESGRDWGVCFGGDDIDCAYINDDKYADILVGAFNGGQNQEGRVYLYYGAEKGSMDATCDHTLTGEGGMFGWNTALGNIDGNTYADLIVSACFYSHEPEGNRVGRAYLYCTKPFPSDAADRDREPQFVQEGSNDVKSIGSLHQAAAEADIDLLKLLISKGANINSLDNDGGLMTPMHTAIIAGHKNVVEVLLSCGAHVNATDSAGCNTPLHRAVEHGHKDIVSLLLNAGAEVNAKTSRGQTPLHLAKQRRHTEVIEILTKAAREQEKEPSK